MKKIYILPNHKKKFGSDYLSYDDFNPCIPFFMTHPNILPESYDEVVVKGVLETGNFFRSIIRHVDFLLKKDGVMNIQYLTLGVDSGTCAVRFLNDIQCEVALVFKERIRLLSKEQKGNITTLKYQKIDPALDQKDDEGSFSFGIVSDGRKNAQVIECIRRIQKFKIPNYEILICGPSPFKSNEDIPRDVTILDDTGLTWDARAPICRKKNMIIENAKFGNLLIMHDRIVLPLDWYERFKKHGNYYDIVCMPITAEQDASIRMNDWSTWRLKQYDYYPKSFLSYERWSENILINGGFIMLKSKIAKNCKMPFYLHWAENEDVEYSKKLSLNGYLITFARILNIQSKNTRLKGSKTGGCFKKIRTSVGILKRFLTDKIIWYKYKKSIIQQYKYVKCRKNKNEI